MNVKLFEKLFQEGTITPVSLEKVKAVSQNKLFSLHWELKTILYLSVLLLSGGLGILIYKNIDTIGHQVILAIIALLCVGCFYYCFRKKLPFARIKVASPNSFYDYILLLGCLLFISFIAYLQAQYNAFGSRYGLATFIPLLVLFFSAYYFDHLGVLSMAITNLGAWMGLAITPMHILKDNDFSGGTLIYTGLLLGVLLVLAAILSERKDFKKHFAFTYMNFGIHIVFISCLAGMFVFERVLFLWFLLLLAVAFYFYRQAMSRRSFYFLLIVSLYTYVGVSAMIMYVLSEMSDFGMGSIYLGLLYYILSAIAVVRLLIILNRKMKTNDSIQ